MQIDYRFLSMHDFAALHAAFLEAFSDYFVPFQLTEAQLENHIVQNAVDLHKSVGAFTSQDGKMIGFTLNGFGLWNEGKTAYDAGTGVIPEFRGRNIGAEMFAFMLPTLKEEMGVEQMLLEVITQNERAVRLYRKLDFRETRKLILFEQKKVFQDDLTRGDFEIREIAQPDWQALKRFWDGNTSWQNSPEALDRNLTRKVILGAFERGICAGYGVVFPKSGIVPQLAVDKNFRRRGIASKIIYELANRVENLKLLRFSNVDERLENAVEFLKNRNFRETFSQFEMIKTLPD